MKRVENLIIFDDIFAFWQRRARRLLFIWLITCKLLVIYAKDFIVFKALWLLLYGLSTWTKRLCAFISAWCGFDRLVICADFIAFCAVKALFLVAFIIAFIALARFFSLFLRGFISLSA